MKILLLQPPIQDFYETALRQMPLGLCYLKAALETSCAGVRAKVLDLRQGFGKTEAPLPEELSYLADYYGAADTSPFCTFSKYRHFGATYERAAALVKKERPDLVGISCLFSAYHLEALALARAVKRAWPCPIVMGGGHASAAPLSLLEGQEVDFVVLGEGEKPLVELARALREGQDPASIPGLALRSPGGPVFTGAADNFAFEDLPLPDLSDLAAGAYRLGKKPLCFVQATRGCPMGCTFCTAASVFGRAWRKRPVENVLEEVRLRAAQGYGAVDFEDDNLNCDPEYFAKLLHGLARGPNLSFCAMNGLSGSGLDSGTLELMKKAGFSQVNLPLVSADKDTQNAVKRPLKTDGFVSAALAAHGLGLGVTAYQILGLPGESLDSMLDTLALLAGLPVLAGVSVFYLAPGCPMAGPDMSRGDFVRARSTALGPDPALRGALYTLFICGRIINFLKGLPVSGQDLSLGGALDLTLRLGPRAGQGAGLLKNLLDGKGLEAVSPEGSRPLDRFQEKIFFDLLGRADVITTLSGDTIRTRDAR